MDVLIFGGSFDPPHLGHARLLKAALARLKPDRAYVVPAYRSPLKGKTRASAAQRLALARRAFAGLPVDFSTYELHRGRAVYTYETLRHMKARHPGAKLTFLLGSDAYAGLNSWNRPAELRAACSWLVAGRPGMPARGADRLPGAFPDISSSQVRCALLAGEDVSRMLAAPVLSLIRARGLYGTDLHRRLAAELSSERYRHSLAVARMALELARLHGLDGERAALAGLLHDCGRAVPAPRMAAYARARRLAVPLFRSTAQRAPLLLHAYIGEDRARRVYGVADPGVLGAIRRHTLGAARMSALDRLLYVADACSEDRAYPEAAALRVAARSNLDAAFAAALRVKLEYALKEGTWIHPLGPSLWNRLQEED